MNELTTQMQALPLAEIAAKYAEGASTRQLAAMYGVGKTFMANYLKKNGCALRPRSHDRDALLPGILQRFEKGDSVNAIALETGVANATVKRWLQEAGVSLPEWQKDLTGQTFGRLTALSRVERKGKTHWICTCSCGGSVATSTYQLISGNTKSCGCLKKEVGLKMRLDVTGERYGRLLALKPVKSVNRGMKWEFLCDCGNTCVKRLSTVRAGQIKSCGCLLDGKERSSRLMVDITGFSFGKLTATKRVGATRDWEWSCDCGGSCVATKHSVVKGYVKSCGCLARGEDSVSAWINGGFRSPDATAVLYVFPLAQFGGYSKIGISTNVSKRKNESHGHYGELHDFIELPRLDAWLIEQAALHATKYLASCPAELAEIKWAGYTEVRRMGPAAAFKIALDLHDQLQELGRSDFAVRYVPMTPAEQRAVAKLAA